MPWPPTTVLRRCSHPSKIKASASPDKIVVLKRQQRSRVRRKVRRWQQAANADDNNEGAGTQLGVVVEAILMASQPKPLERPRKRSTTDPEARFMHARRRFVMGYSAQIAVSDDHLIIAQQVIQKPVDYGSLGWLMVDLLTATCGQPPGARGGRLRLLFEPKHRIAVGSIGRCLCAELESGPELNLGHPAAEPPNAHPRLRQMRQNL